MEFSIHINIEDGIAHSVLTLLILFMKGIFLWFYCCLTFYKIDFLKYSVRNIIRVLNSLDLDQDRRVKGSQVKISNLCFLSQKNELSKQEDSAEMMQNAALHQAHEILVHKSAGKALTSLHK